MGIAGKGLSRRSLWAPGRGTGTTELAIPSSLWWGVWHSNLAGGNWTSYLTYLSAWTKKPCVIPFGGVGTGSTEAEGESAFAAIETRLNDIRTLGAIPFVSINPVDSGGVRDNNEWAAGNLDPWLDGFFGLNGVKGWGHPAVFVWGEECNANFSFTHWSDITDNHANNTPGSYRAMLEHVMEYVQVTVACLNAKFLFNSNVEGGGPVCPAGSTLNHFPVNQWHRLWGVSLDAFRSYEGDNALFSDMFTGYDDTSFINSYAILRNAAPTKPIGIFSFGDTASADETELVQGAYATGLGTGAEGVDRWRQSSIMPHLSFVIKWDQSSGTEMDAQSKADMVSYIDNGAIWLDGDGRYSAITDIPYPPS